jgi:hypothetical protein
MYVPPQRLHTYVICMRGSTGWFCSDVIRCATCDVLSALYLMRASDANVQFTAIGQSIAIASTTRQYAAHNAAGAAELIPGSSGAWTFSLDLPEFDDRQPVESQVKRDRAIGINSRNQRQILPAGSE